jgi:hypothetical protein
MDDAEKYPDYKITMARGIVPILHHFHPHKLFNGIQAQ